MRCHIEKITSRVKAGRPLTAGVVHFWESGWLKKFTPPHAECRRSQNQPIAATFVTFFNKFHFALFFQFCECNRKRRRSGLLNPRQIKKITCVYGAGTLPDWGSGALLMIQARRCTQERNATHTTFSKFPTKLAMVSQQPLAWYACRCAREVQHPLSLGGHQLARTRKAPPNISRKIEDGSP